MVQQRFHVSLDFPLANTIGEADIQVRAITDELRRRILVDSYWSDIN